MKPLNPNDAGQLRAWASSLARTRPDQIRVIRDLLVHAGEDEMSEADRTFVVATLKLLTTTGRAA